MCYAQRGQKDEAIRWLTEAAQQNYQPAIGELEKVRNSELPPLGGAQPQKLQASKSWMCCKPAKAPEVAQQPLAPLPVLPPTAPVQPDYLQHNSSGQHINQGNREWKNEPQQVGEPSLPVDSTVTPGQPRAAVAPPETVGAATALKTPAAPETSSWWQGCTTRC